jgi:hypothetical protein
MLCIENCCTSLGSKMQTREQLISQKQSKSLNPFLLSTRTLWGSPISCPVSRFPHISLDTVRIDLSGTRGRNLGLQLISSCPGRTKPQTMLLVRRDAFGLPGAADHGGSHVVSPWKMIWGRPRLTSPEHSTYAKKESANVRVATRELYPISYVYK